MWVQGLGLVFGLRLEEVGLRLGLGLGLELGLYPPQPGSLQDAPALPRLALGPSRPPTQAPIPSLSAEHSS